LFFELLDASILTIHNGRSRGMASKQGWAALCLGSACAVAMSAPAASRDEQVAVLTSHRTYEEVFANLRVSDDGKWALRTAFDGMQLLVSLPSGVRDDARLNGGLAGFERAAFCAGGMMRLAAPQGQRTWLYQAESSNRQQPVAVPLDAAPLCSEDAQQLAYVTATNTEVWIGNFQKQSRVTLGLPILRMSFSHDGKTLFALGFQLDSGLATLYSVSTSTLQVTSLAHDLDAGNVQSTGMATVPLGVAPGDDAVFLPLASTSPPDVNDRQKPFRERRWLKLYRFDLKSRALSLVRSTPGEDQEDPVVAGHDLYWVGNRTPKWISAAPTEGGPAHKVNGEVDGFLPTWRPDGKRLSYVVGDFRRVEVPVNLDVHIVGVDTRAKSVGSPEPFIVGNNEDFPPSWSPDGRWIAYHSHRAPQPVPYYGAPGTSDALYLRDADKLSAPEQRLTQGFIEYQWVYWAPDGRSIIYSAQDSDGIYKMFTGQIDPSTGRALSQDVLPLPAEIINPLVAEYSPRGDTIAVQDLRSPTESALWLVSRDLKGARKLVTYRNDTLSGISWTPDGRQIAYSALDGDRMQIFTVGVAGGQPVRVTDGSGNYMHPRVSPDGRWIAFSNMVTVAAIRRTRLP
jgi:Tol biopolymer transport system component